MNKGTVSNRIIKRSIIKHIARTDVTNAGVGIDYSVLDETASRFAIIAAEGFSEISPDMAYIRGVNNLAMSGASPDKMMITLIAAPETSEQILRDIMHRFTDISREQGVAIIGGNTVFAGESSSFCNISVTVFGKTLIERRKKLLEKVKAGDKLAIIGEAGRYGASLICSKKREELRKRFSESYLEGILNPEGPSHSASDIENLSLTDIASKLIDAGATYLHDVSFGGIYRTLVEMSEYTGLGVDILHEKIPILQSTIELSEFYNINPYQLLGTGAMVAAFPEEREDSIKSLLTSEGLIYDVAGVFTTDKSRVVHSENYHMSRSLGLYESDEIYKVLSAV